MIVDAHTHIFPPDFITRRSDLTADSCFGEMYTDPKARMATIEELVASMDEAGVDISVALAIAWDDPGLCKAHNDYLIDAVERFPGRVIGMGMIPLKSGSNPLPELERIRAGGLVGIGEVRGDSAGVDLTNEKVIRPVMEFLAASNMFLLMHASEPTGHSYAGKGGMTPEVVYPFVKKYPDVRIILGHLGGGLPFYMLQPEVKSDCRNVYFDSAAIPFLYEKRAYRLSGEMAGIEKILFGSDFPLMSQKRALKYLNDADLSPEDKKRVLGYNAMNLFKIKSGD